MSLIEVKNITKVYKIKPSKNIFSLNKSATKVNAVDDISFKINRGEIIGYIGKNGAGKSTTIKILSGILLPTSGVVTVDGIVPYKNRIKNARKIGVVFGQRSQLYWDLPVIDSFCFLRKLYQVDHDTYQQNMNYFDEFFSLQDLLDRPVRKLSLGQRMKCDLCAALLHSPEILYLDEPTIGLDILTKNNVREFIKKINQEKKITVMLTTHDIEDIEHLSSRIILIDQGKKMYDGPITGIQKHLTRKRLIKVVTEKPFTQVLENIEQPNIKECHANFVIDLDQNSIPNVINAISGSNVIKDITVQEPNLEQILFHYYQQIEK